MSSQRQAPDRVAGSPVASPVATAPAESGAARVVMLVLNDMTSDARVRREARTLADVGLRVDVIARASSRAPAGTSDDDGFRLTRLEVGTWLERVGRRARAARGTAAAVARPPGRRSPLLPLARHLALRIHRPLVVAQFATRAVRAAGGEPPRVVHAHDGNVLLAAALIARRHHAVLVYDAHELWRERNRHGERRFLARFVEAVIERMVLPRADLVVTVSKGIGDHLAREHRLRRPPLVVRNVPILHAPDSDAPDLRLLAGVSAGRLLLYTGRIMSGRGLDQALRILTRAPGDLQFVLLGATEDEYLAGLQRAARRLGVADRLHYAGSVSPRLVTTVARQADVALVAIEPTCASYRYALPNKLFEAVHAGLPVIASDLPEIGRWVRQHEVGEVFAPGDDASMLRALRRVLDAPEAYRAASSRARQEAHWGRERGRLEEAYLLLLQKQPPGFSHETSGGGWATGGSRRGRRRT